MMWRVKLTWRAGPAHGCDAALRPRGRAAHGPREAQEARVARTRGKRPRGEWRGRHLEGPRVSGPWLEVCGGNANALPRPSFYTHDSLFFIPCGTMFPRDLSCTGHLAKSRALEAIGGRRSRGPESTRSSLEHVRQRIFK